MRALMALVGFSMGIMHAVPVTERISSYPFVSGDTFRAYADHIIDETGVAFNLERVKKGDVIFVKTDFLAFFFSEIHPRLMHPYILITHNSDYAVPQHFGHYLDDPKLFAWFGQNVDRNHPKLHAIPIGLANHYWPHGKTEIVAELQKNAQHDPKTIYVYINYDTSTCNQRKNPALESLARSPFAYNPGRKPFDQYVYDLAHSRFVVSPPGNGPDCHRTWEALYLGAIPIVLRSALIPLYEDLPVLIVDDWAEVTEQKLARFLSESQTQAYNLKKIYVDYWFDLLRSAQKECREQL